MFRGLGGSQFESPPFFSKDVSSRERVEPWIFEIFNIIINFLVTKKLMTSPYSR